MAITPDQLKAMSFGYLTGSDLMQFCPSPLLIKQYEVDNSNLQNGCDFAYAEVTGALTNLYDIATELGKTAGARAILCVKVTALHAIGNIMGNAQAISEKLVLDISMARKDLLAMRNGQLQLPLGLPPVPPGTDAHGRPHPWPASNPELVRSSFSTLG